MDCSCSAGSPSDRDCSSVDCSCSAGSPSGKDCSSVDCSGCGSSNCTAPVHFAVKFPFPHHLPAAAHLVSFHHSHQAYCFPPRVRLYFPPRSEGSAPELFPRSGQRPVGFGKYRFPFPPALCLPRYPIRSAVSVRYRILPAQLSPAPAQPMSVCFPRSAPSPFGQSPS